jgi:cyclophilin family peptidyl-prolyl cis-trans isomerase
VAELYAERAPLSVNNFVTLANLGYYDGLTWHRVEKDPTPFVIQGGDPLGTGQGGPGYTVPAEIGIPHLKGALAYARLSDQVNPTRASSGSQFYITLDATPQLDGGYTVFGQVIEGMDVADQIEVGDTIERIDISEAETSMAPTPPPPTPTPEPKAPVMEEGRPLADLPLEERDLYYNVAPGMVIDTAKTYQATVTTDKGEFVIDLNLEGSPIAVNSFVLLSELGFYDNMPVAYVEPDNYAILGSPLSQPSSDAGYTLEMEPGQVSGPVPAGTVIMYPLVDQATGEIRVSGSQFLIAFTELPEAGAPLAVLGQISSGQDVVNQLESGDIVTSITITES